ncbi:MAG: thiamine pyrophosphate-dependent enzyme [Crocinitomicaceae bacterium]|nr:thiamine pyrophosphate-dependent enzyme [Crocinitomicaceae bacterium]MDP4724659.1 thiamine pyrophosphate-dependent enzyme [Crocinitomicaceae bacterium]MDP4739747.1 thiamine pyrophosphate-dependent enzyme [Crocinitomicaceae bacterium]MDP4798848.1 thiamine pyrophosphate-dependent enzyme [Crocinitomicaceae bacterium]MDP4806307.1 thiamine pyrophosphate-dependent enzyme [Crocinitomicaceae bacterium]
MAKDKATPTSEQLDFNTFKQQVLLDYQLACESREASLLGRKEVLTGKAKFGIFGDGKELAQIALAKQFQNGDFRSGYYRDQTLMMAISALTIEQYFAGLYAHTDVTIEPQSAGRQMGGHYATRNLDQNGQWKDLMSQKNSSADISPTAGQMPRLLGLAQASKVYREHPTLKELEAFKKFTNGGNEVAFGTIGDASTSEGPFWETMNAAGVLQVPMVMSVWDDGYGISVPRELQTTKSSISDALAGFQRTTDKKGFEIFTTKGWDYAHLCETYEKAVQIARTEHIPVLVHVKEVNQPQGHSTSGSHERYKSEERLTWETEFDCIAKFKEWILSFAQKGLVLATEEELESISSAAKERIRAAKNSAWQAFTDDILQDKQELLDILNRFDANHSLHARATALHQQLSKEKDSIRRDLLSAARLLLRQSLQDQSPERYALANWVGRLQLKAQDRYSSYLYSASAQNIASISKVPVAYATENQMEDGRIILRENYRKILETRPEVLVFGEDAGKIGGVNQSLEGLQEQFGNLRVSDTGIRECTIIGQGIGLAMRGLRPIAEIQYLDYLLYGIQIMSDDLATVQYRTKGGQKAPLIISTRGHRLEGIWHSGSPMGMIINSLRGVHVCVPRNMTKAAAFYNTLLQTDEPALVIEPLNGYRSKERMPLNFGEFTEPLGVPEIVKEGTDLTLVSYGSTFNICEQAVAQLADFGISVELIDAQTLLPFDIHHLIGQSLAKTNALLIVDEDVSSGASAFMLDQILVKQNGYQHLDLAPQTMAAKDHRPAYGSDGDYFSKPNLDDIIEKVLDMMHDLDPQSFPKVY